MIKTEKEKISHGKNTPRQTNEQGDLFGFDDSAIKTAETLSKLAAKHIREVGEKVNAAKHAIKNPEAARKLGVKVKKDAQKLLDNALLEQQKWEHWYTDSELTGLLRKEAGISDNSVIKENLTTETSDAQKTGNIEQSKKATAKENLTVEAPGTSGESTAAGDEALLDKYEQRFGNVVNTDNMKLLLPGYDPHSEKSVVDAHKTAAPLTGKMFDRMLAKLQKGDTVIFTGGGNGSGKSSVLSQSPDAVFVMDSTMANADITRKSVQDVLDRGGKVVLAFAYRNPYEAWFKGVLKRNRSEDGHIVPKNTFTNTHSKAKQNFIQLAEEFGNKVELRIRDNDTGKIISLEELKQKPDYTKEEILEVINGVRYGEIRQGVSAENQSDNGGRSAGEIEQRRAKISGTQAGAVEDAGRVSREKEKGLTVSVPQNYKTFDENGDWRLSKPAGKLAEDFVSALDSGKKLISQLADGRSIRYRKDGDIYTVTGVNGKERTFSRNGIHSFIIQDLFREDRTVTEDTERVSSVDKIRGFADEMLHDLNTLSVGDYAMFGGSKKYPATYTGQVVSVGSKNIKLKVKSDMYGERILPFPREEYKGHWTKDLIEQKRHYSIKNLWTGSAADYDEPSLQYIGTGEGAQVYGWGLYATDNRSIAEWYAENDAENKRSDQIYFDGVLITDDMSNVDDWGNHPLADDSEATDVVFDVKEAYDAGFELNIFSASDAVAYVEEQLEEQISAGKDKQWKPLSVAEKQLEYLRSVEDKFITKNGRHLYRQTFWPGKEENLLLWNEDVTEDQVDKIIAELRRDERFEEQDYEEAKKTKGHYTDVYPDTFILWREEDGLRVGKTITRRWLEQQDGELLYKGLADTLGSPQAASEFLYRAGIDGVKYPAASHGTGDGSKGWNYVAFSDEDIRVDEHIRYSLKRTPQSVDDYREMRAHPRPEKAKFHSVKELYDIYKREYLGQTIRTISGHDLTFNPGHFFRLIAGTPKNGVKGWIAKASDAEDARRRIEAGEIDFSDIAGYQKIRANNLLAFKDVITDGDFWTQQGHTILFGKKYAGLKDADGFLGVTITIDNNRLGTLSFSPRIFSDKILSGDLHWNVQKDYPAGESATAGAAGRATADIHTPDTDENISLDYSDVKPDSENNSKFSITPEQDAEYLDAVKRGDMETARRMVRNAAAESMPDTKVADENGTPLVVYHGTPEFGFTVFDKTKQGQRDQGDFGKGFYFTPSRDYAATYGKPGYWNLDGDDSKVYDCYLNLKNPLIVNARNKTVIEGKYRGNILAEWMFEDGEFDGIITKLSPFDTGKDDGIWRINEIVVFTPEQIKSADPVTYDDVGNVIPLSERFNQKKPDIRYSLKRHRQVNPIVQDGEIRDEYQKFLDGTEYTPDRVANWDKDAIEWIRRQGGIQQAAEQIANETEHKDRHVAQLVRAHVLNSEIFRELPRGLREEVEFQNLSSGEAWGKEGAARRLASLTLNSIDRVRALFRKLHENMPDEKLTELRNKVKDNTGVDILICVPSSAGVLLPAGLWRRGRIPDDKFPDRLPHGVLLPVPDRKWILPVLLPSGFLPFPENLHPAEPRLRSIY